MQEIDLQEIQAPLKARYRENADTALLTLKASGVLGEDLTCSVDTGGALVAAGLHPATGGNGLSVCSGDMLLAALVACAGVTLLAVANSIGIEVRGGQVTAEGDIDFRGTLAVDPSAPVGFKAIRLAFAMDADASEEQMATLLRLTERYCVVLQSLRRAPEVETSITN